MQQLAGIIEEGRKWDSNKPINKLMSNAPVFREFTKLMSAVESGQKYGADEGYEMLIKVLSKVMSKKESEQFLMDF